MYLIIVVYRSPPANSGQVDGEGRKDLDGVRAHFSSGNNNIDLGFQRTSHIIIPHWKSIQPASKSIASSANSTANN